MEGRVVRKLTKAARLALLHEYGPAENEFVCHQRVELGQLKICEVPVIPLAGAYDAMAVEIRRENDERAWSVLLELSVTSGPVLFSVIGGIDAHGQIRDVTFLGQEATEGASPGELQGAGAMFTGPASVPDSSSFEGDALAALEAFAQFDALFALLPLGRARLVESGQ